MDAGLYWTDEPPRTGWRIFRADGGDWRAEQLAGPRVLTGPNVNDVLKQLAGEDVALQRRYSETQITAAATQAGADPVALVTALRNLAVVPR